MILVATLVRRDWSAPWSNRTTATSSWPSLAVMCSAVHMSLEVAFGCAPCCSSRATLSTLPSLAEMCSAVCCSCNVHRQTAAFACSSIDDQMLSSPRFPYHNKIFVNPITILILLWFPDCHNEKCMVHFGYTLICTTELTYDPYIYTSLVTCTWY